ncbi:MAG: hypothetical protein AB4050_13075 [Synechococcus sp.]
MKILRLPRTAPPAPASPMFEVFGKIDASTVIAPIALVVIDNVAGSFNVNLGRPNGDLVGTEIQFSAVPAGKITSYDFPLPAPGLNPTVTVSLNDGLNVSAWPSASAPVPASVKGGDQVFLETIENNGDTTRIPAYVGTLQPGNPSVTDSSLVTIESYFPPSRAVSAYTVSFNNSVLAEYIGARVIHGPTNSLLGMLLTSGPIGLVYPASKI